MNDSAYDMTYDISHLLDVELPKAEAPAPRVMQAVPSAPTKQSVTDAQEALARELMQAAVIHDALVQQYLHMRLDTFQEAGGQ